VNSELQEYIEASGVKWIERTRFAKFGGCGANG
jgi:hypothetical protein